MPSAQPDASAGESPARAAEWIGRLVIAASLAALLLALWSPRLESAASWVDKEVRVLPRLSVFALAALCALLLQGARPSRLALLSLGLLAAAGALWLLPSYTPADRLSPAARLAYGFTAPEGVRGAAPELPGAQMLLAGPLITLLRFELSLFAALLLGTWLGRDVKTGAHFVALLLCAIVGDIWLSTFRVPESVSATHPLNLLRIPWPPPLSHLGLSPAFADILVLSAIIESARALRFHLLSLLLGAVAGYAAASFLALEPWPAWPALSMTLFSCGVLAGCWPDLKCDVHETGRAFLLSAVLLAALIGLTTLQRKLHPVPAQPIDVSRYHNVT